MVAMTCAHGYAQLTGRAQAVVVHVDCGTQSLGGAVHNAAKARIPVFVFAGLSPSTQEGEATGSRNEFIQWIQDVPDQRGIVRQYMKYDNELRNARNVKQIVHRSLQLAHSDPKGPVYLVGAREVMEAETQSVAIDVAEWPPIAPTPLAEAAVASLVDAFQNAARPLIVISYVGRNPAAVTELVRTCGRLGVGVLESVPSYVNYPHNDPLYQGNQWNHPFQNRALAEADFILVVDSDVPWIPAVSKPSDGASIAIIDADPLKQSMPLWSIKARQCYRADAATAFAQLNARLDRVDIDEEAAERRRRAYGERHRTRKAELDRLEAPDGDVITPEYLTACRASSGRARGDRAQRRHHQLSGYLRSYGARKAGHDVRERRWLAGLDGRRGHWDETGGSRQDLCRPHRRRLLHVFRAVRRALDGAPLSHAVSADHL
jgi:acetolactate synthase-1/2/3 large subunit